MKPPHPPFSPRPLPRAPQLAGDKVEMPHRVHLTDGRILEGGLYRSPATRLLDHLRLLTDYVALVDASTPDGEHFPFVAVNLQHVILIEEVDLPWIDPPDRQAEAEESVPDRTDPAG